MVITEAEAIAQQQLKDRLAELDELYLDFWTKHFTADEGSIDEYVYVMLSRAIDEVRKDLRNHYQIKE